MSFVALTAGVEALAKNWLPSRRPTERFKRFLAEMLPHNPGMKHAAGRLYGLRCDLLHDGFVFPEDTIDGSLDDESMGFSAWWALARACRLAAVNWLRTRAGLSTVPVAGRSNRPTPSPSTAA